MGRRLSNLQSSITLPSDKHHPTLPFNSCNTTSTLCSSSSKTNNDDNQNSKIEKYPIPVGINRFGAIFLCIGAISPVFLSLRPRASLFPPFGFSHSKRDAAKLMSKVLGGILHTKKSIEEWSSFKYSRIWEDLSKREDKIMSVLSLSFNNLESPSLKQCFAYCSMFKKDFEIERDNLIQLWMAQGLLHASSGESKDMEEIGNEYFDNLLQSSLFQDATMDHIGIISKCKMHDLVHDLAKDVSKSENLTGDLRGIDNTLEIRHVARVSTSALGKIQESNARKLRSLFFDDSEVPTNILPRFKALRILNLSNADIEEFPVSVCRLKHLRYLDISKTRFKALPKSIGKLYNLQTLRARNCALREFPKELQNLTNLRHIYFDESMKFPQGLGRLTCLRTLPYFSVDNEIGCRIEELADLKQLKGELIVRNLEHVKNKEEAKKAKLEDKTKVCHLEFKWTTDRSTTDNNEEEDVLEGLRPHSELESLRIENFMGVKFPSWIMSGSLLLNNVKNIQLLGCKKCEGLPPLGHLPNLTKLRISKMANLKCVGTEFYGYDLVHNVATTSEGIITLFPALNKLDISGCDDLIEWMEAPVKLAKNAVVFPCLKKLYIQDCSKLRKTPSHFPFLQKFTIISTPIEELSSGLTTLTSLKIKGIKELTCLPQGILKKNNNLSSLEIRKCVNLTCIGSDVFGSCSSLEILVIDGCPKLRHVPDGLDTLPHLAELHILNCSSLEWIPDPETKGMGSLRKLSIQDFHALLGPLSLWASLVELRIFDCNNLTSIEIKGGASITSCLQKLEIIRCSKLTSLPAFLQQCPSLQELNIRGCPKLASFGVESSSLEEEECISDLRTMTSLRLMRIINCERLESWMSSLRFPPSLEKLVINDFNLEIFPSLDSLNSLRYLEIVRWRNLKYLSTGLQLPKLRNLAIGGFWEELDSFPDFQVGSFMHLTRLYLRGWPKLKFLPRQIQHLTSLTYLKISSFSGVETLPEWLGSLTSLAQLFIYHCKNLINLPSVQAMQRLTKLHTLCIYGCHPLLKQRCTRDSGTDWPKISHIPRIKIEEVTQ